MEGAAQARPLDATPDGGTPPPGDSFPNRITGTTRDHTPNFGTADLDSNATLTFVRDDAAGTATLVVPRASFGTVGPGWTFTLALTGQDGEGGNDNARPFTQYPGAYAFGVCPVGGTEPICSYDPNSVPEVMDTITPPGVSQATELNPTLGPVVLQGVTVGGSPN